MKKYLLLLSGLAVTVNLYSQDLHFSQFNETPSLVNPALTGSQYVLRAGAIYKNQWGSVTVPYTTFGASFEMKLKASAWDKQDPFRSKSYKKAFSRMAAGLSFFNDKAGDGNMGSNQVNLSLATFIKTGSLSTISIGMQGTVVQKSVTFDNFIFSNQYNGSAYDPLMNNYEDPSAASFVYLDVAAGALYNYIKEESAIGENDFLRWNMGAAVYHLNNPKQKYLTDSPDRLYGKITAHASAVIGIPHSNAGVAPSVLAEFQGPQKEIIFGLMGKYYLKDDSRYTGYVRKSSIGLGVYYRNSDALIASLLLEIGQYAIGMSYDLNTSGLKKVSTLRGGPEITLRFNSANPFLFQKRR
jgi:type IX secretion system PorP/SprF family membrane protein